MVTYQLRLPYDPEVRFTRQNYEVFPNHVSAQLLRQAVINQWHDKRMVYLQNRYNRAVTEASQAKISLDKLRKDFGDGSAE